MQSPCVLFIQAKNLLLNLAPLKNSSVVMEIVSHCIMSVIIMTTVETTLMSSAAVSIVVVAWKLCIIIFLVFSQDFSDGVRWKLYDSGGLKIVGKSTEVKQSPREENASHLICHTEIRCLSPFLNCPHFIYFGSIIPAVETLMQIFIFVTQLKAALSNLALPKYLKLHIP